MGENSTLYSGGQSRRMLGSLFAMWLHDYGDISDWANAPQFGALIHAYSDLSLPVVAVWLGIDPDALAAKDHSRGAVFHLPELDE
jgi:hypothetical protein